MNFSRHCLVLLMLLANMLAAIEVFADTPKDEPYYFYQQIKDYKSRILLQARGGDLEAIYKAGYNYYYSANYFEQDYALAYQYLFDAASKGHGKAATTLGHYFQNPDIKPVDHKKAAICFMQAATHKDWYGTMNLAVQFWNGEGVVQDYIIAYALYEVAGPLNTAKSYQTRNQRTLLENKVLMPEEVAAAKSFAKSLAKSDNYFITIARYLKLYDKKVFDEPLLAFDLD